VAAATIATVGVMQIGQLARMSGLTTKTIRYYESIGLLDEPARTAGGYRSYGLDVLERLDFIRQAKASGLTLTEIGSILEIKDQGGQTCDHTRALLPNTCVRSTPRSTNCWPREPRCSGWVSARIASTRLGAPTPTGVR
jgi:hypothetical protein